MLFSEIISIFLTYLETLSEKVTRASVCIVKNPHEFDAMLIGATRRAHASEECDHKMWEVKMGIIFIKVGVILLLLFICIKAVNAVEKVRILHHFKHRTYKIKANLTFRVMQNI